jgi:indolepyruvate ferredoxin oxidoreductase beta subunit
MEALRYLPWLAKDAWLVTNSEPFINIPDYPPIEKIHSEIKRFSRHILINADQIAKDAGNIKASNMVILGAASAIIKLDTSSFEESITELFKSKGEEVVQLNLQAFRMGKNKSAM